jgi:hypothetical protein
MKPVRESQARRWAVQFNKLVEFRADNGHCNVTSSCTWDPELGKRICNHRERFRKGLLSKKRIQRFKDLGFRLTGTMTGGIAVTVTLVEFKEEHGHCNVPDGWPESLRLARWVMTQRQVCRKRGNCHGIGFRGLRPSVSSGVVRNMHGMRCTGGWSNTRAFIVIVMSRQDGRRIRSWAVWWSGRGTGGRGVVE